MATNLSDQSIIEWAASWVPDEPPGQRDRFAKALREELRRRFPDFEAAQSECPATKGNEE